MRVLSLKMGVGVGYWSTSQTVKLLVRVGRYVSLRWRTVLLWLEYNQRLNVHVLHNYYTVHRLTECTL